MTPAHPRLLVAALVAVQAVAATIATIGAVVVGIVAVVLTAQAGVGTGMLLYFPMLFFAGIYLPLQIMPQGLQSFSAWTPPGAAVTALGDAWSGTTPSVTSLVVLVVTAAVAGGLASRVFRWA